MLRLHRALSLVWRTAPRATATSLALLGVQAVLPLVGLYLFKLIVDAVVSGPTGSAAGTDGFGRLASLIGLAALVAVAAVVASATAAYASETLAVQVTDAMLDRLNSKSVEVDYAYYEDPQYYNTLHRAQQEAPFRPTRLLFNLIQVVQSAITSVGILILLATVHVLLAAVVVIAVLPALALRVRHARRLNEWQRTRAATDRQAGYIGWLMGNAAHAKEVRAFDLGDELRDRFRILRARLREGRLDLARARGTADAGAQVGASLVVFGSYAFIAYQTLQGMLTVGDLAMYFGAVQRGQSALQSFFSGLGNLYEDNLFLSNVDEFFELEPEIRAPSHPRPVPRPVREGIVCEGVQFRYPGSDGLVLDDVHLEVRPGETIALVGPNGSGKTTLVKLLCRLYDPTAGSIRLDGIDLREFEPRELRRQMTVVFQDYARYHLSARDNIWFGDVTRPASPERIRDAARVAGADGAIERLRHGYDTVLGRLFPEGEELSIGEWQKIALARAFLSDAQILIVDEPTSALDATAEAEVFRALGELARNRATIVVSHRLSTVRMASRIYCMERGRVVEAGSHDQLMSRGGVYARLFGVQAEMYRGETAPTGLTRPS